MYPHTKFGIPTSNKIGDMLPTIGLDKLKFQCKIVNNSLPTISLAYVLGTQKNSGVEMVLLSTHNICFG